MHPAAINNTTQVNNTTTNYFSYEPHKGWLYLHVLTMVLAWVIVMPVSTMLSIAGSRHHASTQIVFLIVNAVGIVFSTIYNGLTPDLYPNNFHHKLGWALACILGLQAVIGVLASVARRSTGSTWRSESVGFLRVPTHSPGDGSDTHLYRRSRDSGHGASLERDSGSEYEGFEGQDWSPALEEKSTGGGWVDLNMVERYLSSHVPFIFNNRVLVACDFLYSMIARLLIPLAFTQISLGVVTSSGIFMGSNVFNGLAHFIKGGIFFLYGILTLGRWLGAFGELGWAWNLKPTPDSSWRQRTPPPPPSSRYAPSAEMVESGLIFVYGCANVFLEHLASWGGVWSHSDLQHVSIAFMFFGGGLLGLLIESRKIRRLLTPGVSTSLDFSLNPLPAIVIFVLGILMSQHHQHSHLSTMIHTQWGVLLAAGAVFRLLTYMQFFRSPPTSAAPSRPPTEVVAAFCFMAGGLVFMASNKDTVAYLERIGVDAMFSLTVTVGVTALVMSWVTVVMAVKGWAVLGAGNSEV
ncbi:hypothetical protein BDD12DRAFT_916052 [Trichophaea hybrida]|nr:hypothetical protein BDD12DRAFT_916052 [Trichophaea hybrida]